MFCRRPPHSDRTEPPLLLLILVALSRFVHQRRLRSFPSSSRPVSASRSLSRYSLCSCCPFRGSVSPGLVLTPTFDLHRHPLFACRQSSVSQSLIRSSRILRYRHVPPRAAPFHFPAYSSSAATSRRNQAKRRQPNFLHSSRSTAHHSSSRDHNYCRVTRLLCPSSLPANVSLLTALVRGDASSRAAITTTAIFTRVTESNTARHDDTRRLFMVAFK